MMQAPVRTITAEGKLHQVMHSKADREIKVECNGELLVKILLVLNLRYDLIVLRHLKMNFDSPCADCIMF
jgi:hypothetical protein